MTFVLFNSYFSLQNTWQLFIFAVLLLKRTPFAYLLFLLTPFIGYYSCRSHPAVKPPVKTTLLHGAVRSCPLLRSPYPTPRLPFLLFFFRKNVSRETFSPFLASLTSCLSQYVAKNKSAVQYHRTALLFKFTPIIGAMFLDALKDIFFNRWKRHFIS